MPFLFLFIYVLLNIDYDDVDRYSYLFYEDVSRRKKMSDSKSKKSVNVTTVLNSTLVHLDLALFLVKNK